MKSIYCRNKHCWDCRHNTMAEVCGEGRCGGNFSPMYNLNVVRLQYQELDYYNPTYFRWLKPSEFFAKYKEYVGHRVILLGHGGDIRTGEIIAPNSAPTNYIPSGEDVWFRYSRRPTMVICYPITAIVGIIDMDTYSKTTHRYRMVEVDYHEYKIAGFDDLPF